LVTSNSGSVNRVDAPIPALRVVQYEALIWVTPPPKKTSSRKKMVAKLDPITYGPADFTSECVWPEFLTQMAHIVDSSSHLLTVSSFEWRWQKPANSLWVPLRDESGYTSFLRKLHAVKSSPYIIFRMDAPAVPVPLPLLPPNVPAQVDILAF
jgi:hypothetical protein